MKEGNKKKFKLILIIILFLIIIGVGIMAYRIFNPSQNQETLNFSLFERRWIEENKNEMIDIAILNDVPIFGSDGIGIIFSFLNDFTVDTELDFNKIPYNVNGEQPDTKFIFRILKTGEKVSKNDLIFYDDSYVMLSKVNKKINYINDIGNVKVGLLKEDITIIPTYLGNNILYNPTDTIEELISLFNNNEVNYIIIPRNLYLDIILENNYYVVYTFSDLSRKYVLTYKEDNRFKSIINKYYRYWMNNNYNENYHDEMFTLYCSIENITDENKMAFKSKRYVYGYIDNKPYETLIDDRFIGINSQFINNFATFADIEITYKKYSSFNTLFEALKNKEVDFVFNYYNYNLNNDYLHTIETIYSDYVILSHIKNNETIDTFKSLDNKKVAALKYLKITEYIRKNTKTDVKLYDRIDHLLGNNKELILIDYNTYNCYKNTKFKNYNIIYQDRGKNNYEYIITNKEGNTLFYNIFQYYLSTINHSKFINDGMNQILLSGSNLTSLWLYLTLIPILLIILFVLIRKKIEIRKAKSYAKAKYIDPLTSLKNRYYLNYNMPKWEENTIYPQAIVVINLNNIKDVNNNYGQEEGDRLIKMTANILINNQLERTDIIRIDGDEFLIYMVGYDEAEVNAYAKKLDRLLKDLPYDYGASIGYSMILDDIKTIDDAINEAILEMLTNKEMKKSGNV